MIDNNISDFVHLHVHTQYSLLDGAIRLDDLFKRAAEFNMHSVAITDHGTMFGVVEFHQKALKAGIRPVIGCESYVAPRTIDDRSAEDNKGLTHLVLLAKNNQGYKNLCQLATIAQLKGFYYKPRIDRQVLKQYNKGLIGMSACLHGEIPRLITANRMQEADEAARFYQDLFGEDNFFLEVQNNGIEDQKKVNQALLDMSQRLSIPLVASNDCHYLNQSDVRAHEILLCIQTGSTVNDRDRFKFSTDQLYFKDKEEMSSYFKDYPEAVSNTVAIAKRCEVEFDFSTYHFPKYDIGDALTVEDFFDKKVREGFALKLKFLKEENPQLNENLYRERLEYELKTIIDMEFPGYFLIVADFIQYAKTHDVPVGPGRGSAAGSIVAYSLGITDLDPLKYDLIFERFLNPARISMPDIDVDFCIRGRDKVFQYVVEKYGGGDYVAQIITFGKLKTRAVIRDVGRALDIPLKEVDAIAKMVPDVLNISLEQALAQEPKIDELRKTKPEIAELINICRVLEGLPRHASTHAAGVVIGDKPLVEYLPLFKGKKGEVVTQLDMKLVEKIGLVKFDFLGLRNLTVINDTLALIRQQKKTPPDISRLDLNDSATYKLLAAGDTTGVFQLESSGMKNLLLRMKPQCFDDVIALVALYRPGPLNSGMADTFVERKHGREPVEYPVPQLEAILKETCGVIIYQEQVMQIAGALAGYSMAKADDLRKAMGKKNVAKMAEHRDVFVKGAVLNQIPRNQATHVYDLMESFGEYGFNKSHSAAYALIAFQTAYLKAHFQVEFMAALLTSEMHSIDGVVKYITECRGLDIEVLPPDINESGIQFSVTGKKIRFGLVAVKNVGEAAIQAMISERDANGRFTSLFNFCGRVDLHKVNKRVVESLIKCGAFDSTKEYRSRMAASLEEALEYGQRIQREKADPQMSLFDTGAQKGADINQPVLSTIDEWQEKQRLDYEKEALGFYLSGHPLDRYADLLEKFTNTNTQTLSELREEQAVRLGGTIAVKKVIITKKKGEQMAFLTLEDLNGTVEIVVFPSVFALAADFLVEEKPILVEGTVQKEEKAVKIIAQTIIPIEKAEETWTADIHFYLDMSRLTKASLVEFKTILNSYPGSCPAFLHLCLPKQAETIIAIPQANGIKAGAALTRSVNAFEGCTEVETICKPVSAISRQNHKKKWGGKYKKR